MISVELDATLSLEFGWMRVFRLSGDLLTRDRAVAEQDRKRRIARRQADVSVAAAALLRLPVTTSHRQTPHRAEFIGDLLDADVLPPVIQGVAESLTAIDDATWVEVARLRDLLHPEEVEQYGWSFTLLDQAGRCLDVPGAVDPLSDNEEEPPVAALSSVLGELTNEGWRVAAVDTERYPPEGTDADEWIDFLDDSLIRAVRYELVRPELPARAQAAA